MGATKDEPVSTGIDGSDEIPGTLRRHVHDPFGNRIELVEAESGAA